ncbi:hypothetical protein CLV63_12433 [Murinocardiopsis flavida]|uniref:Uncharacterized protein n=1 Tax=Murinocardiopsis flavida TaxID=645275 RepID=A0A2P8CY90_9ACTN|nr:DUF6221 family protein [Murinocardiopsis flavida]PSK89929.1 hypothetical protein CLV63_12433 [Murinocardiopsis flavida]
MDDLIKFLRTVLDEDARTYATLLHRAADLPPGVHPAQLSADVEAKRTIVTAAEDAFDDSATTQGGVLACHEATLRRLAAAYDSDERYRQEWRP